MLPQTRSACTCFVLPLLLLFFSLAPAGRAHAGVDYVKVYHPHINQAEALIMAQDYAGALQEYQRAFGAVPRAFARDQYNAAVCATLTGEEKRAMHHLEKLVEAGVSLEYLEQQEVFAPLREHKSWKKFAKKYPKRRKAFREKTDLDLRADLDELWARDQFFRQAKGGLKVHGDTIRKIEDENVKKLLGWISQYGYPGEKLIGVADTLEQLPRFSIVIQRQTVARNGYDFTPILTQAVQEGQLDPQAAAYLMDQQQGKNLYRSKVLAKIRCDKPKECEEDKELKGIGKRFLAPKLSEEEERQVNERRAALGLEPLADYSKKVRYAAEDLRFKLGYPWAVINYQVPSKEAAKVLAETMGVVD